MKLSFEGYEIESNKLIGKFSKFNLFKLNTIQTGKMKGKVLREAQWFDTTLENCLKEIAKQRMETGEETKTVDKYIKKFEKMSKQLDEEIKRIDKEFIQALIDSKIVEK